MALMPVCIGSCTGLRPMMPGAWISMRRGATLVSGPLPSIGSPSALTTRPSTPSPTGTDKMSPVARTVWPSSMASTSPRTTAPIDSSSRLRARPKVPSSNWSSSLTAASGRPETRAMPSPTSSTRPTWDCSIPGANPSRFFLRAAVMSAVLIVSSAIWCYASSVRLVVGDAVAGLGRMGQRKLSRSWLSRRRTLPSMMSSPIWVTRPPTTVGSTVTRISTSLPVEDLSAAASRCC